MNPGDLRRLGAVVLCALLFGWATQEYAVSFAIFFALYIAWLHRYLSRLLRWLRFPKQHEAPEPTGVFEELSLEIDYLRERHKKRKKRLGSYLKQFQRATRALPDGTVVLDDRATVQWANKAARDYLGVRWPDDVNQRITNLIRTPKLVDFIEGRIAGDNIDIPSPIDPRVLLNVRLTPYGDKKQQLFIARDVTQLHRVNQIRSDFVANVSHELRTPITVIRGYLENMLRQKDQCPPAWNTAAEQMTEHVERMQSLVESLLMLSRLEQTDRIEDPEPVKVGDLLIDIHQQSLRLDAHDDHIFALEVDADLQVLGSAKELYSAFSNLIFNAVTYTESRGVIEIRWSKDDNGAHLVVRDNGIGIPEDHLPRLTERFYRVDPSRARSRGGTGLGLAIVKHVLTRHGATLNIESEVGKGSTFRCDFPASAIVEEPVASDQLVSESAG